MGLGKYVHSYVIVIIVNRKPCHAFSLVPYIYQNVLRLKLSGEPQFTDIAGDCRDSSNSPESDTNRCQPGFEEERKQWEIDLKENKGVGALDRPKHPDRDALNMVYPPGKSRSCPHRHSIPKFHRPYLGAIQRLRTPTIL